MFSGQEPLTMPIVDEYERRSVEVADTARRFLAAVHTGGIAVAFGLVGALVPHGVPPRWATWPVALFVAGLVVLLFSWLLAKHKALRRRNAALSGNALPDYSQRYLLANFFGM